jgi:type VI secretion system protein VasG
VLNLQLKPLVSKLNDTCRQSLEASAGLCLSRTNYNVEIEHWLLKLLDDAGNDFQSILKQFSIDQARLKLELTRSLDKLKTGNSRAPSLSPTVVTLIQQAWLISSIENSAGLVRSGHLICALLSDDMLKLAATGASRQLDGIRHRVPRRRAVRMAMLKGNR